MPLNLATLDSDTPRTTDGRAYPDHLRAYEPFDSELLPLAALLGEFTYDDLALRVDNGKVRSVLPRWLASAEWRGLIERRDADTASVRLNAVTPRGIARLERI
jgi:hypothetical protein